MVTFATLAYLINWGWLRIGRLMYAVAIIAGLSIIKGYTTHKGMTQAMVYHLLWWCIVAGLIGGRLYFVIQQPNFVSYYLAHPEHILATWEGGMAFFGAIFLVIPTLFWRSRVERINPLVAIDAGVLFAAGGQIFGLRRPGVLMLVYLYAYAITQFFLFFVRANDVVSFLGLNWGLKQAQWTSLVLLIVLLPLTYVVLRYSKPVPEGEVAATYGVPQKSRDEKKSNVEQVETEEMETPEETGSTPTEVETKEVETPEETGSTTANIPE